jgi:hypothetical protein
MLGKKVVIGFSFALRFSRTYQANIKRTTDRSRSMLLDFAEITSVSPDTKQTVGRNGSLNSLEFKSKPDLATVLWIRIRNFLGLTDPDPSLFIRIRIWIRSRPSSSKKARIYTVL